MPLTCMRKSKSPRIDLIHHVIFGVLGKLPNLLEKLNRLQIGVDETWGPSLRKRRKEFVHTCRFINICHAF